MIVTLEGVILEQRINESGRELDLAWEIREGFPEEVAFDLDLKAERFTGQRGDRASREDGRGEGSFQVGDGACPSSHGQSEAGKTRKEVRET